MTSLIRGAKLDKSHRLLEPELAQVITDLADAKPKKSNLQVESAYAQTLDLPSAKPTDVYQPFIGTNEHAVPTAPLTCEQPVSAQIPAINSYKEYFEKFNDELSQLRTEAAEQGHREGLEAGREEALQEMAQGRKQLAALISKLGFEYERDLDGIAEIGAEIVFEAVTRIIGSSYIDRAGVTAVVREVIGHAKDRSRLVIRVSPSDYQEVRAAHEEFVEAGNSQMVEILADHRVELGGCLLETPAGNLDGRLEVQLQQLRDTLLSARLHRTEAVLKT
jgi:flagellar assembly protein FliH